MKKLFEKLKAKFSKSKGEKYSDPHQTDDIDGGLNDMEDNPPEFPGSEKDIPDIPSEFNQDLSNDISAEHSLPDLSPDKPKHSFAEGLKNKLESFRENPPTFESLSQTLKKFKVDNIISTVFSEESRPKVHRAFIWTLSLGASAMIGQIIGGALTIQNKAANNDQAPVLAPPQNNELNQKLSELDNNNLFKAAQHEIKGLDNKPEEKKPVVVANQNIRCTSANKKSTLPIELVHTVVLQDSVKSIAAVSIRGEKEDLTVREGDEVKNLAKIEKIDRLKLIFKNLETGQCEYLMSDEPDKRSGSKVSAYEILSPKEGKKLLEKNKNVPIKNEGNNYKITKDRKQKLLSNIDELLTQALAIQIKNPDGSLSFKMTEIVPGSFYNEIGIQNGDIIKEINGKPITNLNQVMGLLGKIDSLEQFQMSIIRNGQKIVKDYELE